MTHIDFNSVGGFFYNVGLKMSDSNLLDRGKIAALPAAEFSTRNMEGWILAIPLGRAKIPPDVVSGPIPKNVLDLSERLEESLFEEITMSFGTDTVGGSVRFAAQKVIIGPEFSDEGGYKGPAIVIKRLQ